MKKLLLLSMMFLCINHSYGMQEDNGKISSEKYSEASTYELLKMCIEYPRIMDVFAYDDMNRGFRIVSRKYDGFSQLYERKDFLNNVIDMFDNLQSELKKVSSAAEIAKLSVNYLILELMTFQESILKKFDEKGRNGLFASAEKALSVIVDNSVLFSEIHVKLLLPYINLTELGYLKTYTNTIDTIHTPNQTPVDVFIYGEFSEEYLLFLDNWFSSIYNATLIGSSSNTYNCHAYAWYMRGDTTMKHRWMDDPSNFWLDMSYEMTNDSTEAEIVCYYDEDEGVYDLLHSARRIGTGVYESKWGSGPLMIHSLTECPYSVDSIVYYKRAYPSLSGSTIPFAPSIYSISEIPSSFTINWSFTGTMPSGIMTGNSPSNTQCSINNSNSAYIKGTLRAYIYNASLYVTTLSKEIRTGEDFGAIYSFNPNAPIPIGNTVEDGDEINVYHHPVIVLQSQDFIDHTITYSGYGVQQFTNNGSGIITIYLSNVDSTITVDGVLGYHHFRFSINLFNSLNLSESILDISQEGNTCNIILKPEYNTEESNETVSDQFIEESQQVTWDLQVVNAYTGDRVVEEFVRGNAKSLDTSTWKSGVYIFKVQMDGQSVEKKVYVN